MAGIKCQGTDRDQLNRLSTQTANNKLYPHNNMDTSQYSAEVSDGLTQLESVCISFGDE